MRWERDGLKAPSLSTSRRIPLAGADILRRYEGVRNTKQATPRELKPLSSATSKAVEMRNQFANKAHGKSVKTLPKSNERSTSNKGGNDLKKGLTTKSKSLPGSNNNGSSGGTGGGWDDNFGDGDDSYNDGGSDGSNDCCGGHCNGHNDHWGHGYHDSWHSGYWGWWSNCHWSSGWGFYPSFWFNPYYWHWYASPYYSNYYASPSAPLVISSTIQTTEIIEVPIYQEVATTDQAALIIGAEANSPQEVQNALQRAAVEYLSLGDRAFAEARYSDAVRHYARAIECSPKDPVLQLVLADALFAIGDYHFAAHCLRRALELDPALLELEFNKRDFYGEPSEFDRQLLLLQRYLNDHVLDNDARLLLGANFLFGGDPDATVALFSDSFSEEVRNSDSGRLLLAAAQRAIAAR
jgi:hypothetical protein